VESFQIIFYVCAVVVFILLTRGKMAKVLHLDDSIWIA